MKVFTVVGARPQFVKAAPVSRALARLGVTEVVVHTGQHYDPLMSQVFYDTFHLSPPKYQLHIGAGTHGKQTGAMLDGIESVLLTERPDWALVYGDTNSTIAGALAASKLHIPLVHVEAGLRSFNREMPEEINRVVTDHLSTILLAPSQLAKKNLEQEGICRGVHVVGDVMFQAAMEHRPIAQKASKVLTTMDLKEKGYLLATVHRAENTDSPARMDGISRAFRELCESEKIVWPVHPRLRQKVEDLGLRTIPNLHLIDPAPYLDMLQLEANARVVLTDSGGVQKEAQWFRVPCVTLRDETEWPETITAGWNHLAGTDAATIVEAVRRATNPETEPCYCTPDTAQKIVDILVNSYVSYP